MRQRKEINSENKVAQQVWHRNFLFRYDFVISGHLVHENERNLNRKIHLNCLFAFSEAKCRRKNTFCITPLCNFSSYEKTLTAVTTNKHPVLHLNVYLCYNHQFFSVASERNFKKHAWTQSMVYVFNLGKLRFFTKDAKIHSEVAEVDTETSLALMVFSGFFFLQSFLLSSI